MTVRKKSGVDNGKIYAMKVLEKGRVTSKRQLSRMLGERNILMKVEIVESKLSNAPSSTP